MIVFKQFFRDAHRRCLEFSRDNRGFALLESVMAVTIFAALGTAVMVGIRTANINTEVVERQSIAEKLARNQMEYTFAQGFAGPAGSYESIENATLANVQFTVESGYTVAVQPSEYIASDTDIELVTVTITKDNKTVLELETLRATP